jgi:hypothetical protein
VGMSRFSLSFRSLAIATFLCALVSCSYRTSIVYLKSKSSTFKQDKLANVYMLVNRPDISGPATTSKSGLQQVEDLPLEIDIDRLAKQVAALLKERGGRLSAYRLQSPAGDPFEAALAPTSLLVIQFEAPSVKQEEVKEEKTETVDGTEVKKSVTHWEVNGSMRVRVQLLDYPGSNELGYAQKKFESSQTYDKEDPDSLRDRYLERVNEMIDSVASKLVTAALPIDIVTHTRELYKVDADSESAKACKWGERGRWDPAVQVWKNELTRYPEDWRPAWNLGVWAEKQSLIPKALHFYKQAQTLSANDPKRPAPEVWTEIFADLAQPLTSQVTLPDSSLLWFSQKVAVLPFTDVTTSIDGPVNIRRLTQAALAHDGYNAMALDEVDRILRENGFTQGGQLSATTPDQLAVWLKADLLLYGHLDKFDEFTLGIFGWKRMNGTMKLWSASKKDFIWISEKTVSRFSGANAKKGSDVAWAFLQQLAISWLDKAAKKPMAVESAYFVAEQLAELPRKPK